MRATPSPIGSTQLPSLTGMRFVAAFLVFVSHAFVLEALLRDPGLTSAIFFPGLALGFTGVGFFFVLSGFVLAWSARADDTVARFLRRRLVKILPNHLVAWVGCLVLAIWAGEAIGFWDNLAGLFLVHAWVPGLTVINGPTWSLSVEVAFYLAFPWLLRLVRLIRPERLWLWAGIVAAGIVAIPFVAQLAFSSEPSFQGSPMSLLQNWFIYVLPLTRALDFTLGILMARIVLAGRMIPVGLGVALPVLGAGFALQALLMPTMFSLVAPTVVPLALVVAAGAAGELRGVRSVFRNRTMVWLGEISYAFFIVHYPVLHYGHLLLGAHSSWGTLSGLGVIAGFLAATILLAWLLHTLVERPCMRRWAKPRDRRETDLPSVPATT